MLGTGGDGLSGIPVTERWDMVTMTSGHGCALLAAKCAGAESLCR
jgi:hypothetical protein